MKNLLTFIILLAILIIGAGAANAATWTVTKAANSNDGACNADCSLREAVAAADSGDIVAFSSNLIGQTITLGGSEIVITKRITIDGFINDPNVAFISGEMTSRIFFIQSDGGLDLRNAILVQGSGESSPGNPTTSAGGAIYGDTGAALSLNRVAIRGNRAAFGGGIYVNGGTHHITNSSLTGNSAKTGTAINVFDGAAMFMSNTTISGNFLYEDDPNFFGGGAIVNRAADLTIRNSTIANNSAKNGGGITLAPGATNTNVNIGNSIVAGNTATNIGNDIRYGPSPTITLTSVGGNLIQDVSNLPAGTFNQPMDITGVNPLLAPTNSNQGGHPVVTHPLQAGSPARNGGINANAVDPLTNQPLTTDARGAGFPRITDTTVDKGAFEDQSGNTSLVVTKKTNSNDLVCDTDCSLREAVHQASLNFGTDTITFAANVFGTLSTGGTEILIQNQNVNIVGYPTLTAETLIVSGGNANRIFHLNNATANISAMTLANGDAGAGFGGAVLSENNSSLTLNKTIVRNSNAAAYGAIFLSGGAGHITNTTINNNSANTGLAIGNSGVLNMANTTVSANFDADGGTGIGAIYNTGTLNIRNSTIAFNRTSGGTGGGIFNAGTLNIGNTIVSNNLALVSPDIHQSSGTITSVGGNLVSSSNGFPVGTFSQMSDVLNVDPLLAALADNGGNVTTHLLMPNSPAINMGISANAVDPFDNSILTTDGRGAGYSRIVTIVDKGAFESLIPTAAAVSISGRVTNGKRGIARAQVFLTGQNGETLSATTNSFGYFAFNDVPAGETYIFNVTGKSYTFLPHVITVNEDLENLNFIPE